MRSSTPLPILYVHRSIFEIFALRPYCINRFFLLSITSSRTARGPNNARNRGSMSRKSTKINFSSKTAWQINSNYFKIKSKLLSFYFILFFVNLLLFISVIHQRKKKYIYIFSDIYVVFNKVYNHMFSPRGSINKNARGSNLKSVTQKTV